MAFLLGIGGGHMFVDDLSAGDHGEDCDDADNPKAEDGIDGEDEEVEDEGQVDGGRWPRCRSKSVSAYNIPLCVGGGVDNTPTALQINV